LKVRSRQRVGVAWPGRVRGERVFARGAVMARQRFDVGQLQVHGRVGGIAGERGLQRGAGLRPVAARGVRFGLAKQLLGGGFHPRDCCRKKAATRRWPLL
jgi:hypothetical protein